MAVGRRYLADKSAWMQQAYSEQARSRIDGLRAAKQLYLCVVTTSELLCTAASPLERAADHEALGLLGTLPLTQSAERHVAEILKALPAGLPDSGPGLPRLFVAAVARAHGATVLHYDRDFEVIADAGGLSHEWVVPRGTGHGRH